MRLPVDLTVEFVARLAVIAACLSQLAAAVAVLARQRVTSRPAPVQRVGGPLALVNYVGIAAFVFAGPALAITTEGTVPGLAGPAADGLRLAGIGVLWVAGLLAIWGVRSMGRHLVAPAEVRPDTRLITTGAFAVVRHPLYDSVLLLWAGGALALLSWILGAGVVALLPAFYLRARAEEGLLVRHFGDVYVAYASRVPMMVPRLRGR
jgi:protein-S-isoprenylcysteine O-methyltransferase Ste14